MNIAIDIRALMSGNLSGVEVYIKNLLNALFQYDQKNNYFLYYNSWQDVSNAIPAYKKRNVHIVQTRIPNKILNILLSIFRYPKIDRLIMKKIGGKKIDAILVPDLRPTPVSKNCKKISTVHDLSFIHFKKGFRLKTRIWHKLLRVRKELQEAHNIITVSEYTQKDVINTLKINPKKISTIYPGLPLNMSLEKDQKKLQQVKARYQLPDRFFLTMSTLEPRKNIPKLIDAFTRWKAQNKNDIKLVIAGKSNPKIFQQMPQTKNNPDIIFTGFISESDKTSIYTLAEALCYISLFEGFGLPIIESLACGTPVLTSNRTSMPEVAGEGGVLINPENIESIMNGFDEILKNSSTLIKKGKKHVEQFDWERGVRKITVLAFTIQ